MSKNVNAACPDGISRRDFLRTAAIGAAVASIGLFVAGPSARSADAATLTGRKTDPTVVDVRSPKWRVNGKVDAAFVRTMIDYWIRRLPGKRTVADAWRLVAKPTDIVGIKFNGLSRDYTGANQAILDAVVAGLVASGIKKEKIIVAEGVGTNWRNATASKTRE